MRSLLMSSCGRRSGMSCQLMHYVPEEYDQLFKVLEGFDAVIVRCNPGQINAADGSQINFDDAMRALQKKGKQIWPSPDVMTNMGAKDALCRIANLAMGLSDSFAYYSVHELETGFEKTMAFQPCVIKQNCGSFGEGIWIIKLKSGNYCKHYGDRSCSDDEVLEIMEACDNHQESRTVKEFLEFCVSCRSAKCKADTPNATFFDIPVADVMEATYLGNLMGQKAVAILDSDKAKMSPAAAKVVTRIEALRGAAGTGVLSTSFCFQGRELVYIEQVTGECIVRRGSDDAS